MNQCKVLVPSGYLGAGFSPEILSHGLKIKPDAIAVDAGSTDSGPYYLGTGTSKMTREAIREDLRHLLRARHRLNIPLLIGSCGTCGTDSGVDWLRDICIELLQELDLSARIALLYSEQQAEVLRRRPLRPLEPAPPLADGVLESCAHIVALMGPEPYMQAVEEGADIVLGGRTTDTAVLCAVPLMKGCAAGPSWHAAKIAECGALCTTDKVSEGVMFCVDDSGFTVEPLRPEASATPATVSAHMLYENSDPYRMLEPGGVLDASRAVYTALDERRVWVEGSRFVPQEPYSMKLEGAGLAGYQTLILMGLQDPHILKHLQDWLGGLDHALRQRIGKILKLSPDEYHLSLRAYGWDGVSPPPPGQAAFVVPREAGIMLVVTAARQELATHIAKLCNPLLLHFPLRDGDAMPSFAFPFSPAEIERGPVYDFRLNHVVETEGPHDLVRRELVVVDGTTTGKAGS